MTLPELAGQNATLLLGKKSGKDSIGIKLKEMGLCASEKEVSEILRQVKHKAQRTKEPIGDKEFETIVRKVTQEGKKG